MSALFQTSYLGLDLRCPLVAASSPFTGSVQSARRLEDAGVGAIVMRSAFEEEIRSEIASIYDDLGDTGSAAALDYFRADLPMRLGPQKYVELLRAIRREVTVPVIASVNCTTSEQWISFARRLETAGADAIELNVYDIPVDPAETAEAVVHRHIGIVQAVASSVKIPVALKIGPF
jgi:dihydroorotate dehydrogenase (fumarate)